MLLLRSLPTLLLHRACIVAAAAEGHCGAELLEGSSLIPPSRLIVMFSHGCSGSSWVPAVAVFARAPWRRQRCSGACAAAATAAVRGVDVRARGDGGRTLMV